ncbi:MAG: hypothetical protein ACLPLR_17165 [Terriglobales bacterium]
MENLAGGANNASDIVTALSGNLPPQVISVTAVNDTQLVFVLDVSAKDGKKPDLTSALTTIKSAVASLVAFKASPASSSPVKRAEAWVVKLNKGNNAADIAAALTGFPQVLSATALADTRLVLIVDVSPLNGEKIPADAKAPSARIKDLKDRISSAVENMEAFKTPYAVLPFAVPLGDNGNAPDIASKLAGAIPGVNTIIPIGNSKLLFMLDETPDPKVPSKPRDVKALEGRITEIVHAMALPYPKLYLVPFPLGTGKNCDVANALVNKIPGVLSIAPVGTTRLAFTIDKNADNQDLHKTINSYVKALAEPVAAPAPNTKTYSERLYYDHDPVALAALISKAYAEVTAQAIVPDKIVLSETVPDLEPDQDEKDVAPGQKPDSMKEVTPHGQKRDPIQSARRTISKIDQPEPQLSLETWSLQYSATKQEEVEKFSRKVDEVAQDYNGRLARSRAKGWKYLVDNIEKDGFLDHDFSDYLTDISVVAPADVFGQESFQRIDGLTSKLEPDYALGYPTLFKPLEPNLVYMLVALAASNQPRVHADAVINAIENPDSLPDSPLADTPDNHTCQCRDRQRYAHFMGLQLECVRDVLHNQLFASTTGQPSTSAFGLFRAAIANFLFQYKMMVDYPDDFQPFLSSKAAADLDAQLSPIVDAFESDLEIFQQNIRDKIECNGSSAAKQKPSPAVDRSCRPVFQDKNTTYASSGIVSVKVVAGNPTNVQTTTQNYFDATPPATLGDFAAAIRSIGSPSASGAAPALPKFLTSNMSVNEAVGALAAIQTLTRTPVTAKIGKGLTLSATAYSLSGAAGAEMDLTVESNENGAGLVTATTQSNLQSQSLANDDLMSRVSDHKVTTRVRVDSLNLFKLSTMESELARGQKPWKPLDPWFEIPVLAEVVKKPRRPQLTYHRSFVFINALLVPTASDLGSGLPVKPDCLSMGEKGCEKSARSLSEFAPNYGQALFDFNDHMVRAFASEYIDNNGVVTKPIKTTN